MGVTVSQSVWTRRWLGWGVLTVAVLIASFHGVWTAVLSTDLMVQFDASGAELGLLHSSYFYIYALMQIPTGILVDRAGTRRVAAAGTAVMSLGALGFSMAQLYPVAFLSRFLIGLGSSVMYITTIRFCANWFRDDEFATMAGLTAAAGGAGGILAATPLAIAVGTIGWRSSILGVGVIGLGTAACVYLVAHTSPTHAGFDPIAGVPSTIEVSLRRALANTRTVLHDPWIWSLGGLLFFTIGTNFTVLGLWGVPYLVNIYDLSLSTASLYILVGNVGFLLGPPVIGWLSDRLERRTELIVLSAGIFTIGYGVISLTGKPPLVVVGSIFFIVMFLTGGFVIAITVAKERHIADASGTATGTVNGFGYLGAAISPAIVGLILDTYWTGERIAGARIYTEQGYRVAFGIAAISGLIACLCIVWIYSRQHAAGDSTIPEFS